MPNPGQAAYAGTKAFTRVYGDGLRVELAGTGVTLTTLCPGPVRTEFFSVAKADDDALGLPHFAYVPSRKVARVGIDALAKDRSSVVPGLPARMAVSIVQLVPNRFLVPILARRHPSSSTAATELPRPPF